MVKLFIDTSQSYLIVGLQKEDQTFSFIQKHDQKLGTILAYSVKNILEKANLSFPDLEQIIVGIGPGSYTGTRIGVAFAESLAYGLGIAIHKIPSLVFYLSDDKTSLGLSSSFGHTAKIELIDDVIHYHLLAEKQDSLYLIDPKNLDPCTNFSRLAKLQNKEPLDSLLYFNLK